MSSKKVANNSIMLTILVILVLILSFFIGSRIVHANESIEYNKSFISIEIEPGDTLNSIAQEHALTSHYDEYISEVKKINNLETDTIHAGCYLMIPIYSAME